MYNASDITVSLVYKASYIITVPLEYNASDITVSLVYKASYIITVPLVHNASDNHCATGVQDE